MKLLDENGLSKLWERIREYIMAFLEEWEDLSIARNDAVGMVRPDGSSTTVDEDGTIHATADMSVIPDWALMPYKPTYTADEVGALPSDTQVPSKTSDLINDSGFITIVPIATTTRTGIVRPDGSTITVDGDGTIHGNASVSIATTSRVGTVMPDGSTITIDTDGMIHGHGGISLASERLEYVGNSSYSPMAHVYGVADGTYVFPDLSVVTSSMFMSCSHLLHVSLPVCTSIGSYAFNNCYTLIDVTANNCSYVGNYAFLNCMGLSSVYLPVCEYIGSFAFRYCTSLKSIMLESCETIGSSAFYSCRVLSQISIPRCSCVGSYAFYGCSSLTTADIPNCSIIGSYAFAYCYSLSVVRISGSCSYIHSYAFRNCSRLTSIYLSRPVPTLGSYAFHSTPIGGYTTYTGKSGRIYVPRSLYDAYRTASGWSGYSSRIYSY